MLAIAVVKAKHHAQGFWVVWVVYLTPKLEI
jgi:hypothetical protein